MGGIATGHVTSGMEDLNIVLHAMQKRVVLQASPAVTGAIGNRVELPGAHRAISQ